MKQKHYTCIVAWAEGKDIQWLNAGEWHNTSHPMFVDSEEYRVKPEPKPDIHTYLTVALGNTGNQTSRQYDSDSVKFTYDGSTHKLKSVEMI
ncbi:hypothetical protein UFOVP58_171 [uncultured Caudovirales phage]|uniref:Uncharacterized protein n=1 Tax=uncultured Caudovirales phage TaxID=2100421 RepID=A0A6J5KSU3_9CAUD|nr:hypothetical protein UFOVP58_171 [uncultured Caudovirales phage]